MTRGKDRPTLLLTRPAAQSARFASAVEARFGAALGVVTAPMQAIEPRPLRPPDPDIRGLVFTSQNAVAIWAAGTTDRSLPAVCVGPRTADAARTAGFHVVATAHDAAALAPHLVGRGPLLHPHGAHVAGRLAEAGTELREAVIYDQRALPMPAAGRLLLAERAPVIVALFSPRSAALARPALAGARAPLRVLALSPAVAAVVPADAIARRPDAAAMLEGLHDLLAGRTPA